MAKSPDAFRTISEVADWLDTPAHVLRFWESRFSQVKPVKRAGGRRYYRPADMLLLGGIKKLLHEDGMTIKGAQKMLRTDGVKKVSALSQPVDGLGDGDVLDIKAETTPKKQAAPTPPLTVVETEEPVATKAPPPADPADIAPPPPAVSDVIPNTDTPETTTADIEIPDTAPAAVTAEPQPDNITATALPRDTDAPATETETDTPAKAKADTEADSKSDAGPDGENDSLTSIFSRLTALHDRMKSDIDPKQKG